MAAPPLTGLIVDALGFLTGSVLYVMLVVMVCRERLAEGEPVFSRRGRLPLLTGVCGLVWNVVALLAFGMRVVVVGEPSPLLVAVAFGALGCLPAVVVHALVEGRETAVGRRLTLPLIGLAYAVSVSAAVLQLAAAVRGAPVPSRPALWLLTSGFTTILATLLLVTRRQPIGRRGVWVAALAVFAVSALHFESHVTNESWWVELIGHHASLLLALAILLQDYRFALADLFLKNAIALLLLMALSLGLFSGFVAPLIRWYDASNGQDPRAVALIVTVWMAAAVAFPLLRRLANRFVDRVVLRRPDYARALDEFGAAIESADGEPVVITVTAAAMRSTLGIADPAVVVDTLLESDGRLVVMGPAVRGPWDAAAVAIVRLRTVESPRRALALGPLGGGRRLLSDDVRLLEALSRLAARRIDAIRVAQERLERNVREQQIERLATEAELRALRAQLNPHFLFNALTTIGHLIQTAPPRAIETLLRLTNVLRGVLRRTTTEFSTLGEEIDLIRSYLDIERARFEERLEAQIDLEPGARDCLVPTLLLQPLVENAVKHGLAPLRAGGRLSVDARVEGGRLRLSVADSGGGFEGGRVAEGAGVGLRSVAQRLQVHYGEAGTMQIETSAAGTVVRVELPARLSAEAPGRRLAG